YSVTESTMKQIIFVLSFLFSLTHIGFGQYTKAKNCSIDAFEASFARAYGHFGVDRLKLPESESKLNQYCKAVLQNKDFSKDYGERCLTGTSQTLLNLQVYNVERTNKPYCAKNGKKRAPFIRWAKCGNAAKPETKKCWTSMINDMANTRKVTNSKSRIPIVCCKYYKWIKCMKASWKATSVCDEEAREGYGNLIHKSTIDSMNLICNRYEDNDEKCNKLFEELPKKKNKNLRETPISYIFDVFESL
ncbi:hypothetical protein BLOT_004259, partial [Blomia tropicalis]